ncbi:hypothetical protein MLC59_16560 [Marinobacter bryozoorum]|uniref:hypothetical protein n=1 Tax=Marinobacter bryozoorum TaxID=256324 RepID=UPI002004AB2E|nr:hypothetical protein [Marinobacter bryozoorum]MCK7545772.1 hypothetical protein [Marinobacter bryozoorum]
MKTLLIAVLTVGLLGASTLALADPGRSEAGLLKAHDRHDGYLSQGVQRLQPAHRGRGHQRHRHYQKGPKWHQGHRYHDRHYRDDRRRYREGHHKHPRYQRHYRHYRPYQDHYRRGSFFGIGDGKSGVVIWTK